MKFLSRILDLLTIWQKLTSHISFIFHEEPHHCFNVITFISQYSKACEVKGLQENMCEKQWEDGKSQMCQEEATSDFEEKNPYLLDSGQNRAAMKM